MVRVNVPLRKGRLWLRRKVGNRNGAHVAWGHCSLVGKGLVPPTHAARCTLASLYYEINLKRSVRQPYQKGMRYVHCNPEARMRCSTWVERSIWTAFWRWYQTIDEVQSDSCTKTEIVDGRSNVKFNVSFKEGKIRTRGHLGALRLTDLELAPPLPPADFGRWTFHIMVCTPSYGCSLLRHAIQAVPAYWLSMFFLTYCY